MKITLSTVLNIILATILLSSIFYVGITSSAPYDPWVDLDEDGDIDIFDIVTIAGAYGTSGNPGRNVTIMHSYYQWNTSWLLNNGDYVIVNNFTGGYKEVTVYFILFMGDADVWIKTENWHVIDSFNLLTEGSIVMKTYNVVSPMIRVEIQSLDFTMIEFAMYVTT